MSFHDEYRPFRNYLRRFSLVESLVDVWQYAVHAVHNVPLPAPYPARELKSAGGLFPWDVDVLAREIALNASTRGDRSLRQWPHLAKTINFLRALDDAAFLNQGGAPSDVMLDLHRIAHRQFPWQQNFSVNPFIRQLKVFGHPAMNPLVVRELGVSALQVVKLGFALGGHFLREPGMSTDQDYSVIGVNRELFRSHCGRLTTSLKDLRSEVKAHQRLDRDWLYSWNPLERTPLVAFDVTHPDRVLCPIPMHLIRRLTSGLYFDLIGTPGFDNAFGEAFQAYVGEVMAVTCPTPAFSVATGKPYVVSSQRRDGVDWILSDHSAHLFIETKTKRLRFDARTCADAVVLNQDLAKLADALVQHYRNIADALVGLTGYWSPDGRPLYLLVLTLEDWFLFSPRLHQMLRAHLAEKFERAGLNQDLLGEIPYTIASAHEFEVVAQVFEQLSIAEVMAKKVAEPNREIALLPFVRNAFVDQMRRVNWRLFADDFRSLGKAEDSP